MHRQWIISLQTLYNSCTRLRKRWNFIECKTASVYVAAIVSIGIRRRGRRTRQRRDISGRRQFVRLVLLERLLNAERQELVDLLRVRVLIDLKVLQMDISIISNSRTNEQRKHRTTIAQLVIIMLWHDRGRDCELEVARSSHCKRLVFALYFRR